MNTEEIKKILGENIYHLRKEYGISRKALARLIQISEQRLRRVENGDVKARFYDFHLKRLGQVFDVHVDELFENT